MKTLLLSILLFLPSCTSPGFDVIPSVGYGRSLNDDRRGEYATIGVSFVPAARAPVTIRRPRQTYADPIPFVPPSTKAKKEDDPLNDDDVVITGSWGIVSISQELLKYIILPLLFGGAFVYKKRKNKIEEDDA